MKTFRISLFLFISYVIFDTVVGFSIGSKNNDADLNDKKNDLMLEESLDGIFGPMTHEPLHKHHHRYGKYRSRSSSEIDDENSTVDEEKEDEDEDDDNDNNVVPSYSEIKKRARSYRRRKMRSNKIRNYSLRHRKDRNKHLHNDWAVRIGKTLCKNVDCSRVHSNGQVSKTWRMAQLYACCPTKTRVRLHSRY